MLWALPCYFFLGHVIKKKNEMTGETGGARTEAQRLFAGRTQLFWEQLADAFECTHTQAIQAKLDDGMGTRVSEHLLSQVEIRDDQGEEQVYRIWDLYESQHRCFRSSLARDMQPFYDDHPVLQGLHLRDKLKEADTETRSVIFEYLHDINTAAFGTIGHEVPCAVTVTDRAEHIKGMALGAAQQACLAALRQANDIEAGDGPEEDVEGWLRMIGGMGDTVRDRNDADLCAKMAQSGDAALRGLAASKTLRIDNASWVAFDNALLLLEIIHATPSSLLCGIQKKIGVIAEKMNEPGFDLASPGIHDLIRDIMAHSDEEELQELSAMLIQKLPRITKNLGTIVPAGDLMRLVHRVSS